MNLTRSRLMSVWAALACAALAAPGGVAQTVETARQEPVETSDRIDRIPGVAGVRTADLGRSEGVRLVRPGALLFASFDRNADARVTRQEVADGAAASFALADKNGDGVVSGFEQSDWSLRVGAQNDVLSNPMLFDVDLDRSVTPAEFAAGLQRLADALADPETKAIPFDRLVQALSPPGQEPDEKSSRGPLASQR
ncbi:MAG: hypothetical protein KGS00_03395 [Alphaproteobacteria bacterium]|nr:hypothetical protein [Alphaproteobacteria bacterium]